MISVVLPSRGRPDSLVRAASSLVCEGAEIIVGLDLDDDMAAGATRRLAVLPNVRVVQTGRKPTTAQLFNVLAKQAQGDWIIPFPDDYTVDQLDWAAKLQPTLDMLPAGLGVAYLWDPLYPHFATFPVLSRKTIDMQGFFMPPFFPFLFGDTWWNEVGVMSGMILPSAVSVQIQPATGHLHRFRDMRLWAGVFEKTRCMRADLAGRMLREAYGEGSAEADYLISTIPEREALCVDLQRPQMTDEFFDKWERQPRHEHPDYLALKANAEAFMAQEIVV